MPSLGHGLTHPLWLVASFALVTVGEVCLSPIGMSATTRPAPAAFATQTMGLWIASSAAGQGISAQLLLVASKVYRPAAGHLGYSIRVTPAQGCDNAIPGVTECGSRISDHWEECA
nr:hypothetical protein [Amycolatopsis sp. YIM 10]